MVAHRLRTRYALGMETETWHRGSYDRVVWVQGHRHSEPVCAHPDCQTYLPPTQMDAAPCADCGTGWNGCCSGSGQ